MRFTGRFPILILLGLLAGVAHARSDFSADTRLTGPSGQVVEGRMVVSKGRVRVEFRIEGQRVVRINDPVNQRVWTLYPESRQFAVRDAPPGAFDGDPGRPIVVDPCQGRPGATCVALGVETRQGRAANKWRIELDADGRLLTFTQWIDVERGFPSRQEFDDGRVTELVMVGMEVLGGRDVERWEMRMTRAPGEESITVATQWFDPALATTIKERRPDGSTRELLGIEVGTQDETLFQIPPGYSRLEDASGYR